MKTYLKSTEYSYFNPSEADVFWHELKKKKKKTVTVAEIEMSDSSNFLSSTVLAIYSN